MRRKSGYGNTNIGGYKRNKKSKMEILITVIVCLIVIGSLISFILPAYLTNRLKIMKGNIIGQTMTVREYDNHGNKFFEIQGQKVNIQTFEPNYYSETGYDSSVLLITMGNKEWKSVGSTLVFAEKGLEPIPFDESLLVEASGQNSGGYIPLDKAINSLKNKIGKSQIVIIRSQLGQLLEVYSGNEVYIEVPAELPKMTRLVIDGKSLYIHRANYDVFDKSFFN